MRLVLKANALGDNRIAAQFVLALIVALGTLLTGPACNRDTAQESADKEPTAKPTATSSAMNGAFLKSLPQGFSLPQEGDELGQRVLKDYGAVFVARGGAVPPPVLIFSDEAATQNWQNALSTKSANIGGIEVTLQTPALEALLAARTEAQESRLSLTPRGTDAARRSYDETITLWRSRVEPALDHWVQEGGLTRETAARIRNLPLPEQATEILRLEKQGFYFSKDFSKSILYSVAAPGTSQHLSLLAFDVKEHENPVIRSLLARHGWFQTILSDLPHFTFLGVDEAQLPALGLKKVGISDRTFWVPQLK